MFLPNGGAETWRSDKQDTIVDLTTEVKYVVDSKAALNVIWQKRFIRYLGVVTSIDVSLEIFMTIMVQSLRLRIQDNTTIQ